MRALFKLALILLITSCVNTSQSRCSSTGRSPQGACADGGLDPKPSFASEFRKKINSTDDVLSILNKLPSQFKEHYLAAFASLSTHQLGTTPLTPRIVMYSADHQAIVAYSGNAQSPEGGIIEIIELNPVTAEFNFHEIQTNPQTAGTKFIANSQRCVGCHQGSPIWQSYPRWLSFYGSSFASSINPHHGDDFDYREQEKWFQSFQKSNNPRYSVLTGLQGRTSQIGEYDDKTSSLSDHNSNFTEFLNHLQAKRVARFAEKDVLANSTAFEILMLNDAAYSPNFNFTLEKKYPGRALKYRKENEKLELDFFNDYSQKVSAALKRAGYSPSAIDFNYDESDRQSNEVLRFAIEDLLKKDWTKKFLMNRLPGGSFAYGYNDGVRDLWYYVLVDIVRNNPQIYARYGVPRTSSIEDENFQALTKKIIQNWGLDFRPRAAPSLDDYD